MSFPASVRKQSTQQSKSTLYLQLFIIDCICCPVEIIRPALLSSAWSESNGVLATRLLRWPQDGTSLPPLPKKINNNHCSIFAPLSGLFRMQIVLNNCVCGSSQMSLFDSAPRSGRFRNIYPILITLPSEMDCVRVNPIKPNDILPATIDKSN